MLRLLPGRVSLAYARLEASLRRKSIASRFRRGIHRDFRSIAPFLPDTASAILDVGCGLAAIDVLLSRHYSAPAAPALYLADFEETSHRIDYDFGRSHAHYNSMVAARELLTANGVSPETMHFISPDEIARRENLPRFQLVISTLAWGFHFPIEVYAEAVLRVMAAEGRLILDVRVGTDGLARLEGLFPVIRVIEENEVRQRVLATR
jgi:SAM-dependent methyltransferase